MGFQGKLYRSSFPTQQIAERINPNNLIGNRLYKIRQDRDMTQRQLALAMNEILTKVGAIGLPVSDSSVIAKIENGDRSLSALEALVAAEVLRVPVTVFAPWNGGEYDYRNKVDPVGQLFNIF